MQADHDHASVANHVETNGAFCRALNAVQVDANRGVCRRVVCCWLVHVGVLRLNGLELLLLLIRLLVLRVLNGEGVGVGRRQ